MAKTSEGGRQARRPQRSRSVNVAGWLLVIVAAAVIPYLIAQATHGTTEATTTGAVLTPSAPVATSSAAIGGASVAAITAPPTSPTPTASASPTSTAPTSTPATSPATAAPTAPVEPAMTLSTTYAVKPGDSLWAIAVSRGVSGDAAIAAKVDQIYADNKAAIGPNRSLLRPGQILTLS